MGLIQQLVGGAIVALALGMGYMAGRATPTPAPLPNPGPTPAPSTLVDSELRTWAKIFETWVKSNDQDVRARINANQSARALSDIAAADRLDSLQRAATSHDNAIAAHDEMFSQVRRNFGKIQAQLTPVRFVRDY